MDCPSKETNRATLIIALYESPANKIFIVLVRALNRVDSRWRIPGGGINLGEWASTAALRELTEETGLIAEKVFFLKTLLKNSWTREDGQHEQSVYIAEVKNIDTFKESCDDGEEKLVAKLFPVEEILEYFKGGQLLVGYEIIKAHARILKKELNFL